MDRDADLEFEDGDFDTGEEDELCCSLSWYRFGASIATAGSTYSACMGPCYVARVEDVNRDREFHNIIGKEYIDGKVHYMVDWILTLVRGHVLRKAQAQPVISWFEARCRSL
jgi:hypothetical protein